MKRDDVIKEVAKMVGPQHSVNLKKYDCLILVDIFRNVLGMSVVDSDYDQLKRFNLSEIWDPTPRPQNSKNEEVDVKNGEVDSRDAEARSDAKVDDTAAPAAAAEDQESAVEPPVAKDSLPAVPADDTEIEAKDAVT